MRLDRFHVEAFGALQDFSADGLAGHPLVVLLGSNESGKSTFLEFLATMLFGFGPADRARNPCSPWDGKDAAGTAGFLLHDGSSAQVTRRLGHGPEGEVRTSPPGGASGNDGATTLTPEVAALGNHPLSCLGSITRPMFRSFHAASHDVLATLDQDAWRLIEERLLGGSHFELLHTAREVRLRIDTRAQELWSSEARTRTRHRALTILLRRLRREREAAAERAQRLGALRGTIASRRANLDETHEQLAAQRARLLRAETLLPVLRGLHEVEDLRRRAAERLAADDLPEDSRTRLESLRRSVEGHAAERERRESEIVQLVRQRTMPSEHDAILAVEQEVRVLVGEAAVHHQDRVHINDLDRARDAQEAVFQEQSAHVFGGTPDDDAREALSRLGLAELQSRVKAWEDARRLPDVAREEVRQAEEGVHAAELDFEALPSVDTERRMRQREEALRNLQSREDVLAALRKDIEAAQARLSDGKGKPGQSARRASGVPRDVLRGGGLVLGGVVLLITLLTGGSTSWWMVAPISIALIAAGAVALKRRARVDVAIIPDEQRAQAIEKECTRLRKDLELHAFETVAGHLEKAQQTLSVVAARPELERRLVGARQRVLDAKRRVEVKQGEADGARKQVCTYLSAMPISAARLENPGQDLYNDLEELRSVLREMTRLHGEREAVARRAREREARGVALAERLEMVLPGSAMDATPLWHERLQHALSARRRAEEAEHALPVLKAAVAEETQRLETARTELTAFEARLARLDFDAGDPEAGLRWLEQARTWAADADALERSLHERFPDWQERGDEARAAHAAGEELDLDAGQRAHLRREIDQLEHRVATLADALDALERERTTLDGRRSLADIDGAIAAIDEERERAARRHDRLALVAGIVDEADRRYRQHHQQPVLRAASAHLRTITAHRWERIEAERDGDGTRLYARRKGARHLVPVDHPLSRGLREQVHFALRLALADQLDGSEPLPLVLDDVLVGWDAERVRQGGAVLAELGTRRQVFVLTCHEQLADRLRSEAGAHVIEMPPLPAVPKSRRRARASQPEAGATRGEDADKQPHAV